MTDVPWLTIVTVVKDDPAGLARTAASLLEQDRSGVEHLVIDSSVDRRAVEDTVAPLGTVTDWTAPAGIYPAMNEGLARASGQYVLFLNAGDALAGSDTLVRLRAAIDADRPTWLHGPVEIIGTDGSVVVTPEWDFDAEQEWAFARGRFPAHQGTVVRTEALRSLGGFDESFSIVADYAAFLRLSQEASPGRSPGVVARFHEGGVSTTRWSRSLREFHRARREILAPTGSLARRERVATARQFATMAAHRSPWPLVGAVALIGLLLLGLTGVSWLDAVLLVALVIAQGVGGALWWRLLRPARSVPVIEAVGMGLGLGTAGAMLAGLWTWWWLMPLAALAAWLVRLRLRGPVVPLAPLERPDLLALIVGLVPGLAALGLAVRTYPLSWVGEYGGYHGDMPFFEALAASVAKLGPGASIFMDGASLKYHSLAYGWAGQLTMSVDAAPFVVLTRLLPYVGLVAAIALTAAWTRQLTRVWWAPSLAVALVITGGFVGATYGSVLNMDSPSQTLGVVWLLALSLVLLQALRRVSLAWHLLAIAVLVIALTGGKISTAAVAAGGYGLVVLVALLRRETWRWRALTVGLVAAFALLVTYQLLLAGSANSGGLRLFTLLDRASSVQGLNPVVTPRGIVAGIALLLIAVVPRWAGLAWLVGDRTSRWAPSTVYGVGLAAGGLGALLALSGGFNDLWFAVAASAPLAVLSAVGVAQGAEWLGAKARSRVISAAVIGLLGSAIVAAVWVTGSTGIIGIGWRWAAPIVGVVLAVAAGVLLALGIARPRLRSAIALALVVLVTMALPARFVYAVAEPLARPHEGSLSTVLFELETTYLPTRDQDREISWTSTQAEAGAWLRAQADSADLVATNLTLGALVPSLTRLTTYISDIHMQAPYSAPGELEAISQREAESWAFIDDPSAETVAPLCAAGVHWVWVDLGRTSVTDWEPWASIAWAGPDTLILRVASEICPA